MQEKDKIIERVRKLLELADTKRNTNINEAASAAAHAQALMSRHAIDTAMLSTADAPEEVIETDILFASDKKHKSSWRGVLAVSLCEVNMCKAFWDRSNLNIIGRASDASTTRYLFAYIVREVERLCRDAAAERGSPGRTWCNNFKLAAVNEVGRRLHEVHAATRSNMKREADASDTMGTGVALVLVNNALAKMDEHVSAVQLFSEKNFSLRPGGTFHYKVNSDGRDAGRRAGASIELNTGKGLVSGTRHVIGRG
jgi:hypothetical protein